VKQYQMLPRNRLELSPRFMGSEDVRNVEIRPDFQLGGQKKTMGPLVELSQMGKPTNSYAPSMT